MITYFASVPGRICFAGEKLDWLCGGCAITAALSAFHLNIYLKEIPDKTIEIIDKKTNNLIEKFKINDSLDNNSYVQSVFLTLKNNGINIKKGASMLVSSTIPPKMGLSSSAALCVALVGIISKWQEINLNKEQISYLSYIAEKKIMGINCGQFDQFAVVYGGINKIDSSLEPAKVYNYKNNLANSELIIVNLRNKVSTNKLNSLIKEKLEKGDEKILSYIENAKINVSLMDNLLCQNNFSIKDFGEKIINANQILQKYLLTPNKVSESIIKDAISLGAYGAKINGKGNIIIILADKNVSKNIQRKLIKTGHNFTISKISDRGLQTSILDKYVF
jgi:galactokinase/mevalonate kinase-like predicted kinase